MSSGKFSTWPHIEGLHKVLEIMSIEHTPRIVVTEKIHGRSVRFGLIDGKFRVGGRNEEFDYEKSKDSVGAGFMGWVRTFGLKKIMEVIEPILSGDTIVYGEWFGKGVQKGIDYFHDGKGFRIFGLSINGELQNWGIVERLALDLNIPTVPILYSGPPLSKEELDLFYDIPSQVALENGVRKKDNILEGIVIAAQPIKRHGDDWFIAKHKNAKFAERTSEQEPKAYTPPSDDAQAAAQEFIKEFWTQNRLEHILTALEEKGLDPQSPKIAGPAIGAMLNDVLREGSAEWSALNAETQKVIRATHAKATTDLVRIYQSSK